MKIYVGKKDKKKKQKNKKGKKSKKENRQSQYCYFLEKYGALAPAIFHKFLNVEKHL